METIIADLSLVRIMQLSRGLDPDYSSQNSDSKVNAIEYVKLNITFTLQEPNNQIVT